MKRQQEWWTPAKAPAAAPKRSGYQKNVMDTKGEYTLHTTREETAGACYRAETERVLSLKQRRQQQRRRRAEQTGREAVGAAAEVDEAAVPAQNTDNTGMARVEAEAAVMAEQGFRAEQ